jgi:hypothetical protein
MYIVYNIKNLLYTERPVTGCKPFNVGSVIYILYIYSILRDVTFQSMALLDELLWQLAIKQLVFPHLFRSFEGP